ncbi:MAG: TIGR03546 family protein [Bythopirellula sp.]|nr:TIGR03546 family protein [Bythopirellula sp.]
MFAFVLRPVRQFAQALVANDSPRQVAWGFVIGMMIGLVPKGNLTAILLGMMLLGLRVNKPAGLMGIGVFTYLGLFVDAFAHRVGSAFLAWEPLQATHTQLFESAVSPIFGLNNTVVVGQLLIGLYLVYPIYWLSHRFAVKVQAPLSAWLLRYKAVRWLRGAELGSQWGIEG